MSSGDLIELCGERVDGLVVGRLAAEGAHYFMRGAEAPDGVQRDDSRVLQVEQAGIGILVEEAVEDLPREVAVFRKVVTLTHVFSALAAGERFLIVGDMTDQVERVEGRADLILQSGKDDPVTFQFFDDGALLVGSFPGFQENIERSVVGADILAGVVTQALGDDLSVRAQVLDTLVDDGDDNAVDGHFPAALVFAGSFRYESVPQGPGNQCLLRSGYR